MALPVNKKKKPKIGGYAKKGKLSLVFDPEARKDYLTGFSKVRVFWVPTALTHPHMPACLPRQAPRRWCRGAGRVVLQGQDIFAPPP